MIRLYKNKDNQEINLTLEILNLLEIDYKDSFKPYKTLISFLKKNINNICILDVCTDKNKIYHINIACGGGSVKENKFSSLLDKINCFVLHADLIKIFNDNLILTDN